MSDFVNALAKDGHIADVYVAKPESQALATVVILQEIFWAQRPYKRYL